MTATTRENFADWLAHGLKALAAWQAAVSSHRSDGTRARHPATAENIRSALLGLVVEAGEVFNAAHVKPWREDHRGPIDLSPAQQAHLLEEYADVLAFFALLTDYLNQWGFTPERLAAAYVAKSEKNVRRFTGEQPRY